VLLLGDREAFAADKLLLPVDDLQPDELPHEVLFRMLPRIIVCTTRITGYNGVSRFAESDGSESLVLNFDLLAEGDECPVIAADARWSLPSSLPPSIAECAVANAASAVDGDGVAPATVALVQPFFPFADLEALSIPLGLATLHACLTERGITTVSFDASIPSDYVRMINDLPKAAPSVVGIQFHSDMSSKWAVRTARWLRAVLPKAVLVGGGEVASVHFGRLLGKL
jgi:hypothetical protein